MGAAVSTDSDIEAIKVSFVEKLKKIKESHPKNLTAKHLTEEFINGLEPNDQKILYRCTLSGLDNQDSNLGCYAMTPEDYEKFKDFFDKVIREYHSDDTGEKKHITDWSLAKPKSEDPEEAKSARGEDDKLCFGALGLSDVSMRIRVGRNVKGFNLPGMMTKEERIGFEQKLLPIFESFIADENFKGNIFSLTPDFNIGEEKKENANLINEEKYKELVESHLMFKNMDNDSFLKVAGISSDWPYGRGCYVSEAKDFIVWFGEEDQLRVMCMKTGTVLSDVFNKLKEFLEKISSTEGIEFATSENYGFVTSCPSNLGTGMRASVHIKVPKLLASKGLDGVRELCDKLKLSVRGVGGEHTEVGSDGTIDLSPKARLFITEAEIVKSLYAGVKSLVEKEKEAPEVEAPAVEPAKPEEVAGA